MLVAGAMAALPAAARAKTELGQGSLYRQPWFEESFLDLRETAASGRHLAVFWERKGCSWCREMHEVNLALPEIAAYVRERFRVVQLDLLGA
jgi:thioredoxin-related protein